MGRLIRTAASVALAGAGLLASAGMVLGFDGFGDRSASSTYDDEIRFEVEVRGDAPERLELVVRFEGDDADFVAPVEPANGSGVYVFDAARTHVTPSTEISYRWRAIDGDRVVQSPSEVILYDDDRPGLDWQTAEIGQATVHWYGGAEAQARRFGELTAVGASRAEELLGHELAGPIDIFVYATRDDFFGALGPGAREWTGAAAYPELRTVFMWLEGGSQTYLERAIVHEVTHVVFNDATDNPYHEPARWLNEGIAVWSETDDADGERAIVEVEAGGGGLFAFEAITAQFPIGERGGRLSYAQGATMIDMIIAEYGTEALARITAAYRDGASDEEALEAGTGIPAAQLYADFYADFGVDPPQPVEPLPIAPSNVDRPPAGEPGLIPEPSLGATPAVPDQASGEGTGDEGAVAVIVLIVAVALAGVGAAAWIMRRAARSGEET
jgi:hypothetical protein